MINDIQPIFKALHKAKLVSMVNGIVGDFLGYNDNTGKPNKISEADDTKVDALQCIYDKLVDLAEDKGIDWEAED